MAKRLPGSSWTELTGSHGTIKLQENAPHKFTSRHSCSCRLYLYLLLKQMWWSSSRLMIISHPCLAMASQTIAWIFIPLIKSSKNNDTKHLSPLILGVSPFGGNSPGKFQLRTPLQMLGRQLHLNSCYHWQDSCPCQSWIDILGCLEEKMTLQTVSKTKYNPDGTQHPVNLMRNLALSAVKTPHIVYANADFLPSTDLSPSYPIKWPRN